MVGPFDANECPDVDLAQRSALHWCPAHPNELRLGDVAELGVAFQQTFLDPVRALSLQGGAQGHKGQDEENFKEDLATHGVGMRCHHG